jgi:NAD dependent epimerase/dehydratase family enzyme
MLRIAIAGATGRIGRPLCQELIGAGHAVTVISRDPGRAGAVVQGADGYTAWQPASAEFGGHLGASDAVVYLAGAAR